MNLVKAYRSILCAKECFTRYRRLILASILLINVALILDAAEGRKKINNRINPGKHSHLVKEYDELTVSLRRQSKEEWNNLGNRIYEKTIENYLQSADKPNKAKRDKHPDKMDQNDSDISWRQRLYSEQPVNGRARRRWSDHIKVPNGAPQANM